MQASPEYRALRKSAALLRSNVNPDDIVTLLFDEELLTDGERDSANNDQLIATKRMEKVYSALERRVRVLPEPFHKFVRILIGVPALKPVAKQLYDLYLKKGGTRQEYAAQFEPTVQPTPDGHVADDGGTRLAAGTANQGTPSGAGGAASQDSLCDTDWFTLANDEHHDYRDAEGHIKRRSDLWQKKELRVFFMNPDEIPRAWRNSDGDTITKKDILEIANEWHNCAKEVIPQFVLWKKEQSSDIRVKYIVPPDGTGNPRSKVGSRASNYSEAEPTMWLQLEPTDEEKKFDQFPPARYKRTIRHEFGHALGLKHEHQHPDAPALYDKAKLKVYLKRWYYPDWSWAEIESKIESQWASKTAPEGESSKYDDHSIMHYEIPVEVWPDEYVAKPETYPGPRGLPIEISATDKRFIKRKYKEVFGIDEETDEMDTDGEDSGDGASGGQDGGIAEDSGPPKGGGAKKDKPKTSEKGADKKAYTPEDFARFKEDPDLNDLMEYVGFDLQAKWEAIALGLGIEKPRIAAIMLQHQGKPDAPQHCMTDVFDEWRRTKPHEYSWKNLAAVLYTRAVGEKGHLTYLHTELSKKL